MEEPNTLRELLDASIAQESFSPAKGQGTDRQRDQAFFSIRPVFSILWVRIEEDNDIEFFRRHKMASRKANERRVFSVQIYQVNTIPSLLMNELIRMNVDLWSRRWENQAALFAAP